MKPTTYIGIDPAIVCGFAYYFPHSHEAHLFECEGNPIEQWEFLRELIEKCPTSELCIETPNHFRNAVTTRDLVGRYGYLKWSAYAFGFPIRDISMNSARHLLGCKTKEETKQTLKNGYKKGELKITDNHTDALAVAMYGAWLGGYHEMVSKVDDKFLVPEIKVIS